MTTKTDAARECAEELPCPFCGAEFHGIFGPADSGPVKGQFWVECKCDCPTCYGGETREECMALWNKRKHFPPSVPVNRLEQLADWWLLEAGAMDKNYKNPAPFDLAKRQCANKLKALIAEVGSS